MICSNCGTTNKAGRRFCVECGAPLAVGCPTCGAAFEPGEKFCGTCGSSLAAVSAGASGESIAFAVAGTPPAPQAPVAERRLVSVLFADLVGFTALSADRDPEETRELLNAYFDLAGDVIGRYGGTVEKFIGDAVMAVWGAPIAREDDAERAVRAGLELVAAVPTLAAGLAARAGVLTGEAAVTLGATNQGMVAGDLVNTASRLQGVAPAGAVLVGEATHRASSNAIAFEAAGEQLLKGKPSPVPAWRALRVVAEVGGRNRSDSLEAPFVGRDEEFRLLKDLFHATSREKRTRLVSVIGPAGIGKSRLAWEFLKYVDGLVDTVWWHDGRSPAYGEGISFWALGEMVRGRCGLLETDDEPTTRAKVGEAVARWVPEAEERRWIEPALLALLGVEARMGTEQLFGAWRTFFERIAATGPLVMVFEDLHFADGGLLDFIDHLLEWSRGVPIYIVTLARPELLERRPDWGAGKRNFFSLSLDPLSSVAMRELLRGLVPGLPEPAVRAIVARADGVPLYAVETVRMLVAEGRLKAEGPAYRPVGDLTALAVPETLTALIASRLDTLSPPERSLVSDAAVLGQSFTLAALAAVSGIPDADLEPRLRTLVRRELLTLQADARSPERGQYAFVQALIREVAYNRLAKGDRKSRHLAAARFFETLDTDELAGALAGHYLAAQRNAPAGDEARTLAAQARLALLAAAERAAALGSYGQAVTFLEQALEVTTDSAEQAATWRRIGDAAEAAADVETAERYLRLAIQWYADPDHRDVAAGASTTAQLGRALVSAGRVEPAISELRAIVDQTDTQIGAAAEARVRAELARAFMLHGDREDAIEQADLALRSAGADDMVEVIADALVTKGTCMLETTSAREGVALLRGALALATEKNLSSTELRAINNLAGAVTFEDPMAAIRLARDGMDRARRIGLRTWAIHLATVQGGISLEAGGWDEVLAAMDLVDDGQLPEDETISHAQVHASIHLFRGRVDDAEALLSSIEGLLPRVSNPTFHAYKYWTRAVARWVGADHADGFELALKSAVTSREMRFSGGLLAARIAIAMGDRERLRRAIGMVDTLAARGGWVDAVRASLEAAAAAMDGRDEAALSGYRQSLAVLRTLGATWTEALVAIEMATVLDPASADVRSAAEAAMEILTSLQARPFVSMLDHALARESQPAR